MYFSSIVYFYFSCFMASTTLSLVACVPAPLKTSSSMRTITAPAATNSSAWMHPSEIAKDCLNSVGQSMLDICQKHSERDYDSEKLNTSMTTTWATCCFLYEELDCYLANAKVFCPDSTRKSLQDYTTKVVIFFQDSLCHTVIQVGWKQWCNNMTHQAMSQHAQHANGTVGTDGHDNSQDFIKLPAPHDPEIKCFEKMRHAQDEHKKEVNLEQNCVDAARNKWNPKKLYDSNIRDSCCGLYDALDCIERASSSTCNSTELIDMNNYRQKALLGLSEICKQVPTKLCGHTSGAVSPAATLSFSSLVGLLMLSAFICRHNTV